MRIVSSANVGEPRKMQMKVYVEMCVSATSGFQVKSSSIS